MEEGTKKINKKWTDNLHLKLLAIAIAVVAWLGVVNISNPEVTRTKTVTLEIINEDVITNAGKTYEIDGNDSITISYDIRTRDEYQIKPSDFRAYIDLADMYDVTGSVPVTVEVVNNKTLFTSTPSARPSVIHINIEEIQTKEFSLQIRHVGDTASGHTVDHIDIDPATVTITGPTSTIGQISAVGVEIPVNDLDSNSSGTVSPVYYDANGNKISIDDPRLTIDTSEISYTIYISKGKSIPITYDISGIPAAGYSYIGYEASADHISVTGNADILNDISSINIPSSDLSVDGLTSDKTVILNMSSYLPSGITIENNNTITILLKVEASSSKTINLQTSNITLSGKKSGYEYKIEPSSISVTVQGTPEAIAAVSSSTIHATIDCSELSEGAYSSDITFDTEDTYYISMYTPVTVTVTSVISSPNIHDTEDNISHESETEPTISDGEVHNNTQTTTAATRSHISESTEQPSGGQ